MPKRSNDNSENEHSLLYLEAILANIEQSCNKFEITTRKYNFVEVNNKKKEEQDDIIENCQIHFTNLHNTINNITKQINNIKTNITKLQIKNCNHNFVNHCTYDPCNYIEKICSKCKVNRRNII